MRGRKFSTITGLLKHLSDLEACGWVGKEPVLPSFYVPGDGRLLLVLGDNATGKSVVRSCISLLCRETGIEVMPLSMAGRASGGMERAFVYGDESWRSTGELSASTVLAGISTCRSRNNPHVIIWDEPDIGMSDEFAKATGVKICRFAQKPPEHTVAIVVSSHSRSLVRELLLATPHYLCMGLNPPPTLTEWLGRPIGNRSLQNLLDDSHRTQKKMFALLKRIKDEKEND